MDLILGAAASVWRCRNIAYGMTSSASPAATASTSPAASTREACSVLNLNRNGAPSCAPPQRAAQTGLALPRSPSTGAMNRYPSPVIVCMNRGCSGSSFKTCRILLEIASADAVVGIEKSGLCPDSGDDFIPWDSLTPALDEQNHDF